MNCYEKGTKIEKECVKIINLFGTWREMGRQYGALLSEELKSMYVNGIEKHLFTDLQMDVDKVKEISQSFYGKFPFKFREFIVGIAETSGLEFEQLLVVNALNVLLTRSSIISTSTSIATWGEYSSDSLTYGINYDHQEWMKELRENLVFTVYHPADGSLATVTIGFAGEIYVINGMNEKGIFVGLNDAEPSGGDLWYESRTPSVTNLFEFLLNSTSLDEMETFFQTTKSNYAYIVGVADSQTARCYEWPVFEVKRRESHSRQGLAVMSNHFTEFSWGLPRPDDKANGFTRSRRQNLLTLAKHLKGSINDAVMMKIMDTKYEDMGATMINTIYQIVVVPSEYKIWFKTQKEDKWIDVNMKEFFSLKDGE
ncbi:MAG: C45 family peptidase [Synergistaceae bacterium]